MTVRSTSLTLSRKTERRRYGSRDRDTCDLPTSHHDAERDLARRRNEDTSGQYYAGLRVSGSVRNSATNPVGTPIGEAGDSGKADSKQQPATRLGHSLQVDCSVEQNEWWPRTALSHLGGS